MTKKSAQRTLEKWRRGVPPEADIQDVLEVVDTFLGPYARQIGRGGSHVMEVYHPRFAEMGLFDGVGRFSIAVHQRRVKKCYIKDILKAIEALEIINRVDEESEPRYRKSRRFLE